MSLIKIDIIKELPTPIKSNVMTAYDTLIQEGMEKGIQKGIQKGRKEGLEEGLEKGLEKGVLNLHKRNFTIPQIADIMEISLEKVKHILEKYKMI